MDGLEENALVVNVVELNEGVAGGMVLPLFLRKGGLDGLPVGLGGGQAVVPVPHGKEEHGIRPIFFFKGFLIRQLVTTMSVRAFVAAVVLT